MAFILTQLMCTHRHDSTHFGFHRSNVEVTKTSCGKLSVNGKLIHVFTERDPKVRRGGGGQCFVWLVVACT
jgi:hypothetical protein